MTAQLPPSTTSLPRPQTISQVSTMYLMLNLAVLVILCLLMVVWLRPLLISQGVEATASTLYALSAGALVFTILSRGTKAGLLRDHREGMAHTHSGRYEQAIQSFQKSYDFLSQSRWVDDLRWLVCLDSIKEKFAAKAYLFTANGSDRAAKRLIKSAEIEEVVALSEVIEDYPDDKYGPSCLLMGVTHSGRILHVQISYPTNIKVITVYEPSAADWENDWKTRKTP